MICPKCGHEMQRPIYHTYRGQDGMWCGRNEGEMWEHLHHKCACGYVALTRPRDFDQLRKDISDLLAEFSEGKE